MFYGLTDVMAQWVWTVEKYSYETADNTYEVWWTLPICYTDSFSSIAAVYLYKRVWVCMQKDWMQLKDSV